MCGLTNSSLCENEVGRCKLYVGATMQFCEELESFQCSGDGQRMFSFMKEPLSFL